MPRRLRPFLSYRRLDADEASELERQLALRGLALWRDVNDLPLGGLTEAEIRRGIAESDAFVLYVTPRVFSSEVIWRVEVPAAMRRARREARQGRRYPIVPVFRGVTVRELHARATALGTPALPTRNGAFVPLRRAARATRSARREGHAAVAMRLLRALLPSQPAGAVSITLRSFEVPEASRSTLDVDWSDAVDGEPHRVWDEELMPALRDLKTELARARRRRLSVFVQARLGVALLAGMSFPLASGFDLTVGDRQGLWPSRYGVASLVRQDCRTTGSTRAVLEVSLVQDAHAGAATLARALRARHVRMIPPRGPSRRFDPRRNAGAISRQIGDIARELRADGMRDLHLVFSGPAALALLVGRHLHAIGCVHCYYRAPRGELVAAYRFRA